eukprot:scaffold47056_cov91-Phaeocystis_antarctica.AAC.2
MVKVPPLAASHAATQKPTRSRSAALLGPGGEPSPLGGRRGAALWLALGCLPHSRRLQCLSVIQAPALRPERRLVRGHRQCLCAAAEVGRGRVPGTLPRAGK